MLLPTDTFSSLFVMKRGCASRRGKKVKQAAGSSLAPGRPRNVMAVKLIASDSSY
jgi:hypothetical protein